MFLKNEKSESQPVLLIPLCVNAQKNKIVKEHFVVFYLYKAEIHRYCRFWLFFIQIFSFTPAMKNSSHFGCNDFFLVGGGKGGSVSSAYFPGRRRIIRLV